MPEPDLTGLMNTTSHALTNRLAAALSDIGLTPRMWCVLARAAAQEHTQIQLAALCDLDKTTMVATVDELEKRGLAARLPSATDRRARIIAVTDEGRATIERGRVRADEVHAGILTTLTPEQRNTFIEVLALLAGTLRDPGPQPIRRTRGR